MKLLKDFTPPRGTTKTVELTRAERKAIGRRNLANFFIEQFRNFYVMNPVRVTIKQDGIFYTLSFADGAFQVRSTSDRRHYIQGDLRGNVNLGSDLFFEFVVTRIDPCSMVRALKLLKKNSLDSYSQAIQKKRAAAKAYKPNFVLVFDLEA